MSRLVEVSAGLIWFVLSVGPAHDDTAEGVPGQYPATTGQVAIPALPPLPDIKDAAYQQAVEQAAPLTPSQIRKLRQQVDDTERAAAALPRFFPKIVTNTVTVSLSPGATPQVDRLFSGYVTTLMVVDQAGNPLIVKTVDIGGRDKDFTVTWEKDADKSGSNYVKISPNSPYAFGNVSITLVDVSVPITLTLVSGQPEVDDRVHVRVHGIGYIATAAVPKGVAPAILTMLSRFGPDRAQLLTSSYTEVMAWDYKDKFYVRTNYAHLCPAYLSMQRSPDGIAVYEIPRTAVVVALSNGAPHNVSLSAY
ncbi:DotH/IcmK family type IV secretion protein [Pseudomonas aeruginosa]|uniref:DotH/IcmK family type IV secretion protein n=1 Tax=Pseudomonas aeruginosa TaxID=287 RepID=UPI001E50EFC1|nr:DotH/IcmK family type IV secretion protein [Pseudomonas aeruginosa]MCC9290258.1 DotH/IcmK family type IV secretion protein [Pseudomonas aeruginosa]UVN19071.1 putative IcmK-like type IV secretion system protein [Pseudomonas aeruginosa]